MSSKILFFDEKYQNFKPKLEIFNEFFIYPKGFSYIFFGRFAAKKGKKIFAPVADLLLRPWQ